MAFWDFDDPAIPNTERDTAATAIASSALLKLSKAAQDPASRSKYQAVAESTITTLVTNYLTPTSPQDKRIPGILAESCFNKRPDARPHDAANKCEFIVADYYFLNACWCWREIWILSRCSRALGGQITQTKRTRPSRGVLRFGCAPSNLISYLVAANHQEITELSVP